MKSTSQLTTDTISLLSLKSRGNSRYSFQNSRPSDNNNYPYYISESIYIYIFHKVFWNISDAYTRTILVIFLNKYVTR